MAAGLPSPITSLPPLPFPPPLLWWQDAAVFIRDTKRKRNGGETSIFTFQEGTLGFSSDAAAQPWITTSYDQEPPDPLLSYEQIAALQGILGFGVEEVREWDGSL